MTTTPRYRAAVIGCGRMAHGHARAYLDDPRSELVACADLFESAATGFAQEFGIPHTYTDYREMLATERLDLVSICTHHHLHAPMTIDTARIASPRAILCEKPIALDLTEADTMIAACEESGTLLVVGHQRRFDRQYLAARDALTAGRIGDVLGVQAFGHPRSSLMVDSTHTVDLVRFFLGDPRATWAMGQIDAREHRSAWGQQIEDAAMALVGFDSGIHLLLGAGSIMGDTPEERIDISPEPIPGPRYHQIVIQGTRGRLIVNGDNPIDDQPLVTIDRSGEIEVVFGPGDLAGDALAQTVPAVTAEVGEMIDCLEQPGLTHRGAAPSARHALEILMAIYESSRRRQAVRLPLTDVPDNPLISMLAEGVI